MEKLIKDDPYGLTRITKRDVSTNMIENQVTKFDSFIQEDSLRYFNNILNIDIIKYEMKDKLDPKTGLYEITYPEENQNYYEFATMFNRLTDNVYAKKVYRNVKLLAEYSKIVMEQKTEIISFDGAPICARVGNQIKRLD